MRPAAIILAAVFAATATVAAESPPQTNIRVLIQFIDLPHPALTALMAGADTSGKTLHASAMAFVKAGQAKVLESAIVTTRDGQYCPLWPCDGVSGLGQNARTTGGAGILPAAILRDARLKRLKWTALRGMARWPAWSRSGR